MAKNKTYTGSRQSVGTPTLNRNSYHQLIRMIRKEMKNAENKVRQTTVSADQQPESGDP